MKKFFLPAVLAVAMTASAQTKKKVPPPPPPPPPVVEMAKLPPPPPPPPKAPKEESDQYKAFLKRNPSVRSLHWNFGKEVIVRLKSGQEERYQLNNAESRKEAEAKYGALPAPPPPPPPVVEMKKLPPPPPKPPKPPVAPRPEQ